MHWRSDAALPKDPRPKVPLPKAKIQGQETSRESRRAGETRAPRKGRSPPRRVTEESLRRSGLYYLQRYAASTRSLRLVLERRVARSAAEHDIDMPAAALWIDSIIERFTRGGLLDDNGFAESRARSLFERGASARMIRAKLAEKGIARAAVDQALETVFADHEAPDITAANRFAQRRRLGPYRLTGARDANRTRDLAALARAGFGFDVARTVIDADSADALEAGGWAAQG